MRRSARYLLIAALVLSAARAVRWSYSSFLPGTATLPTKAGMLTGRVTNGTSPIAGARVRIKGHAALTLTDAQGCFRLARSVQGSPDVTAWKEGFLIGGVSADRSPLEIQLIALPPDDHESYRWVDPRPDAAAEQNCGNCHRQIYDEWRAGGHATAAANERFLNMYNGTDAHGRSGHGWSLIAEHAHGAGVCASCHAPAVGLDEPALSDMRQVQGVAAQGVHCDFCHKVSELAEGEPGLAHGRFALELKRPATGQLFFGPLDDVDRGEDAYSPLQRDSRFCASCHEGVVFGVHVYSTYSEWLVSPARRQGKQCQTCHMRPSGEMTHIADSAGIARDPATLGSHTLLPGGRAGMLRSALKMDGSLARRGDQVLATINIVARNVGHQVPTGFIDRHLMLVVEPFDAHDDPLEAASGPVLPPAAGQFAGRPGLLFAKLLADSSGHSPAPFWRAGVAATDTRLMPERTVEASFVLPDDTSRVRCRLIYRRFWEQQTLAKDWDDDSITVVDKSLYIVERKHTEPTVR